MHPPRPPTRHQTTRSQSRRILRAPLYSFLSGNGLFSAGAAPCPLSGRSRRELDLRLLRRHRCGRRRSSFCSSGSRWRRRPRRACRRNGPRRHDGAGRRLRHGWYGCDADGRGHGAGDHGRQVVGAAELGRDGHYGVERYPDGATRLRAGLPPRRRPRRGRSSRGCPGWARPRATAPASVRRATASSPSSCPNRRPSRQRAPTRSQVVNKKSNSVKRNGRQKNGFRFRSYTP